MGGGGEDPEVLPRLRDPSQWLGVGRMEDFQRLSLSFPLKVTR